MHTLPKHISESKRFRPPKLCLPFNHNQYIKEKKLFEAVQEFKLMRCSHSRWGMAPWRGWGGGGWKSHLIANKSQNSLKNCCFSFTFQTYRSSDRERDRQSQQLKLPRPRDCSMDDLGQLCEAEACIYLQDGYTGWTKKNRDLEKYGHNYLEIHEKGKKLVCFGKFRLNAA